MKRRFSLSLASLLSLAALPASAQSLPGQAQSWHSDEALSASVRTNVAPRRFRTVSVATLRNEAEQDSTGPHRLLVRSLFPILNANRFDRRTRTYVFNVCGRGQTECTIEAGETRRVRMRLPYLGRFGAFLLELFPPLVEVQNQPFQLQLLHNADMDGIGGALENVKPFSALVNGLRATYPDNTLLLSSGDNYIPGPRFSASADESLNDLLGVAAQGRADMAFMNAMGYQASAIGNHELDVGPVGFTGIFGPQTQADATYPGAAFPYLSCNLEFGQIPEYENLIGTDGATPAELAGKVARSTIVEVDAQRIGIIGATTPSLASITSTSGITISPEDSEDLDALAAEIQDCVDDLTDRGVNKIVLLAHMQSLAIEKALATRLRGVDIIVAGGSNTLLADEDDRLLTGDVAADTYPLTYRSASDEPVAVVNTDGDYKYLGRLLSSFDLRGKLLTERFDSSINGVYAADPQVVAALGNPEPNPRVVEISDALSAILAQRDGNILGKSSVYLDGRRSTVRSQESNLGSLTADANLWVAQQYDPSVSVSLKNGGGIRDDIGFFALPPGSTDPTEVEFFPTPANPSAGKQAGDISQFDIQQTLRFNNGLTLLTVSGSQLARILEHGIANAAPGVTSGRFPQVAGVAFTYTPDSDPQDTLVSDGTLVSLVALNADGEEIQLVQDGVLTSQASNSTFRLVTLDFLYNNCGDGYPLPTCDNNTVPAEPGVDPDVVFLESLPVSGDVTNVASFADPGSEQDALAEYLRTLHSEIPFDSAETAPEDDTRIRISQ